MTTQVRSHRLATAEPGWTKEYEAILAAYRQAGGDPAWLKMPKAAILVISANRVLAANEIPGIHFEAKELPQGVQARISVEPEVRLDKPVHLCFGMLPAEGLQEIIADYDIGPGAAVEFLAHCTFPNATRLRHIMNAQIHVGAGAAMTYHESHFHGPHGGIEVVPKANVIVDDGGRFITSFNLTGNCPARWAALPACAKKRSRKARLAPRSKN